jgi:hypothetical protein
MASFSKPTIGPRAYLSLGPSNWFEVFPRREADAALLALLGELPVPIVVEALLRRQKLTKEPIDWSGLLDYLEPLLKRPRDTMEPRALVALWAACIIEQERAKATT